MALLLHDLRLTLNKEGCGQEETLRRQEAGVQDAAQQAGILHRCQNLRRTEGTATRMTGLGRQRWDPWERPGFQGCDVPSAHPVIEDAW